ncbi:MAG: RDD family protein [Jatrophihabitans sp.]|uniref:RDD family protein n=1 Tax=Jatrophihabitans sp. TaxID=1932789 RepID=UPI003F7D0062
MTLPQSYRGERIGLPQTGTGSLAPTGPRLGAYLADAVASALVATLFVQPNGKGFAGHLPGSWSLIPLAVDYLAGLLLAGRTLGMYLFGLRVVRVDDPTQPVTPIRALARTVMLFLLIPALIFDRDGRGLHDRYTDTAVVRA